MDGFCRGCLNSFEDPAALLQYTEESRRLFVYSTGLQVKRNDVFTFQLCKECYLSMKTSCRFKKMCRTSDKNIKNYLALKQVDEGLAFSTFLKRNEDSLTFRLPMLSGGNTPANQKSKDDDNESTCTSIQNFITDLLRPEEIPDSEARIIREVIAEEADVLEDSLDSHWLQDDISVDSDFRLDLSLSKYLTPHSTNEDLSSPKQRVLKSTDSTSEEDYDSIPIDISLKKITDPPEINYVEQTVPCNVKNSTKTKRCVIDKNLEKALQNENNQEIALSDLLASPSAAEYPSKSGASTPTIKQILFGGKEKDIKKSKSPMFECDLDLLLGNFDKAKSSSPKYHAEESHKKKLDFGVLIPRKEAKCDSGKSHKSKSPKRRFSRRVQEKKVYQGKLNEGKIDFGKFSAGKILQEKLNFSKGKLLKERMELRKSRKLCKGKEKFGNMYVEKFDLENFNIENIQESKPVFGKIKEENIDLVVHDNPDEPVDPEALLEQDNMNVEEFQEIIPENPPPPVEPLINGDDSDDYILEEFLNAEKEKLANVEMKRRAVIDLVNAAQMDDSELTELLQEAYDHNFEIMQGKKVLSIQSPCKESNIQSPHKETNIQSPPHKEFNIQNPHKKSKLTKPLSPMENKYSISNFYCKICSRKCKNMKALKIHFAKLHKFKIETGKTTRKGEIRMCDKCGRTFTNKKSLIHHLKNHDKNYQCNICKLMFKSQNAYNTHKMTHMQSRGLIKKFKEINSAFICDICGTVATSSSNLITHMRRHFKAYTMHCEECGKGFYRTTELVLHKRRHTGERPYICPHCQQTFSRRDGLNRHMKHHTDEKPFACEYCNVSFPVKSELKLHQTSKSCLQMRTNFLCQCGFTSQLVEL